ncbi:hypothetical protein RN001_007212 [Aquatica leii]|uniref:Uncharacterized protein n=1 Tax=Aquatica leii TaxID=1421715 RepID=A0AAN7PCT2_9COLE|nr:hypothetical protein RN001_007212 [Aquatica leii]
MREEILIAVFCLFFAVNCKIPDYINVCPQSHPNLSACITESIMALVPRLKSGIPELEVPSLEPLEFDTLSIGGATGLSTNLTEVFAWGASDFKILKLIPTITKNGRKFRFEAIIPKLHIQGNYAINTKISIIEIKGNGIFNANISDCHFECILRGKKVKVNNENHLNFDNMKCNLVLGKSSIYFDNLFNGDPIIGKGVNDAIEDNSDIIFEEAKPNIVEALTAKLTDLLKPRLELGIPELDIPALEPLHINKISFHTGSEASSVATNISNIKIWGASRFQILKLSVHPNENGKTFEFEVTVPHLYIEGHYETNTKILFLDLKGNGPFKANISQYQIECTLKGLVKNIHDINHLKFESLKCKVSMGEKKLQLENLFAINPLIAKATNDIIDDNTDALFLEITPADYLKICHLNDKNYSDCVISSINHLRSYLKDGIKEINVPPMEPLEIDRFSFDNKLGNSLLATNMSDVSMKGVSTFNIIKLVHTSTKKGHTFRIEANIPKIHVEGNYEVNTKLVNVDLHGKGPFTVDLVDYHFECMAKGKKTDVNGDVYLKFATMQCNSVIANASIYLHNLFGGGNLALEKAANEAISQNSASLYQQFRPVVSDVVRNKLTDVANNITMSFKYEELFPST